MLRHYAELDDPELKAALEALRGFIRELPKVKDCEAKLAAWVDETPPEGLLEALEQSKECLRQLYDTLRSHPQAFRNRVPYYHLFNNAANGIGGWFI